MQLETLPRISCFTCSNFSHQSVTEALLCQEIDEHYQDASFRAAADAERMAMYCLDAGDWCAADEALRTASGAIAWYDPQIW